MFKRLTQCLLVVILSSPELSAQGGDVIGSRSMRITAISAASPTGARWSWTLPGSVTLASPPGDVRARGSVPALLVRLALCGRGGVLSTLEHGTNLGVVAGPGSSGATLIVGTAGVMVEASGWFDNLRPTLRLGGGFKAYTFTTNGASSSTSFTGDIGAGFRSGAGPIEISGEVRFLPSAFGQAKLPLRGLVAQDQQQNDLLFTIGVTVKP